MSDPRAELAGLYERAAAELEVAAQHARVAARRLREQEVPRSGAHAGQRTDTSWPHKSYSVRPQGCMLLEPAPNGQPL